MSLEKKDVSNIEILMHSKNRSVWKKSQLKDTSPLFDCSCEECLFPPGIEIVQAQET